MKRYIQFATKNHVVLTLLILIGLFLRLYNFNWGAPYYFHPDERNIASSISQLHFPDNLNPNFFAYGSVPIYLVYSVGVTINYLFQSFSSDQFSFILPFEEAIIIGRVFSTILSLAIIPLLYKTALIFVSKRLALFAASLSTFSVGLIQYAHFGTFEMYLTFFSLLLLYFLLQFAGTCKYRYFFIAIIIIGILSAIKVSSFILFPLPILIALSIELKKTQLKFNSLFKKLRKIIVYSFISGILVLLLFLLGNPFAVLDFTAFYGSIQYESRVATGSLPVFYTQTFHGSIPILFQSLYVLPFLLNPIVWIFVLPALIVIGIKSVPRNNLKYRILLLFFFFLFVPQAILYVKWTRYMVPTIPVLLLMIVISISFLSEYLRNYLSRPYTKKLLMLFACILLFSSVVWTFSLMKTVYFAQDTRVVAANEMLQTQEDNIHVISETYDMGIVPFDKAFSSITLFNFYDLENDPELQKDLPSLISKSDLFILPSQRVVKSRVLNPEIFPQGHSFYQSVQALSQFKNIYTTPCDMWCKLLYLGDPIYGVEDTVNVFDRPTVTIYTIE